MAVRAVTAALKGDTPERTPYSIYDWFFEGGGQSIGDGWQTLFDQGLGRMESIYTVQHCDQGVENQIGERLSRWSCKH